MATKRVHEVAKERHMASEDVLAVLHERGVEATSHLSAVDEADIARAFAQVVEGETIASTTPSVSAERAFAESQAEQAGRVERATFYAKGDNYRIVRVPAVDQVTQYGSVVVAKHELVYDFSPDGRLTLRAGVDVLPDGPYDERIDGFESQDALTFLRRHVDKDLMFWEEGKEPGRPVPSDDVFIGLVTDAAITLNRRPILALLEQEEATHKRDNLIRQAKQALAKIEGTREHMGDAAPAEEDVPIPAANVEVTNPQVRARLERQALAASMASPEEEHPEFVTPGEGRGAAEIVNA
jgi:hypothetical protein